MKDLAPEITRRRFLIEGRKYFRASDIEYQSF
jgi:hypothetical protein